MIDESATMERRIGSLRILVITGDPMTGQMGSSYLKSMGHSVKISEDPYSICEEIDLVFLDLELSMMIVVEAIEKIRQLERRVGRRVSVVAIQSNDPGLAPPPGVNDSLRRPFRAEDLEQAIASVQSRVDESRERDHRSWSRHPSEIRESLPMSVMAMREVVALFRESCVERLGTIHHALNLNNSAEIARNAHALKGSLGMFASRKALDILAGIESDAKAGNYLQVSERLAQLEHVIECLQPTLDRLTLDLASSRPQYPDETCSSFNQTSIAPVE